MGGTQSATSSLWWVKGCFYNTENESSFFIFHDERKASRYYGGLRFTGKEIKLYGFKNVMHFIKTKLNTVKESFLNKF